MSSAIPERVNRMEESLHHEGRRDMVKLGFSIKAENSLSMTKLSRCQGRLSG